MGSGRFGVGIRLVQGSSGVGLPNVTRAGSLRNQVDSDRVQPRQAGAMTNAITKGNCQEK